MFRKNRFEVSNWLRVFVKMDSDPEYVPGLNQTVLRPITQTRNIRERGNTCQAGLSQALNRRHR